MNLVNLKKVKDVYSSYLLFEASCRACLWKLCAHLTVHAKHCTSLLLYHVYIQQKIQILILSKLKKWLNESQFEARISHNKHEKLFDVTAN